MVHSFVGSTGYRGEKRRAKLFTHFFPNANVSLSASDQVLLPDQSFTISGIAKAVKSANYQLPRPPRDESNQFYILI